MLKILVADVAITVANIVLVLIELGLGKCCIGGFEGLPQFLGVVGEHIRLFWGIFLVWAFIYVYFVFWF